MERYVTITVLHPNGDVQYTNKVIGRFSDFFTACDAFAHPEPTAKFMTSCTGMADEIASMYGIELVLAD